MTESTFRTTGARPPAALLDGVRVLDLTNVLSGPFATYQMALLGAEVIKVENPSGGDLARKLGASAKLNGNMMGASFQAQNAGKKSLAIDLKTPNGREVLLKLVQTADVLVENFRPGVMARLGLDYDTLSKINPGLVFCAISGFGQNGPLRKKPAYDQIIQGMSGIMSVTGTAEVNPLRVGFPAADSIGGLNAAMATLAALYARSRTGKGQYIDVSMLDSSIAAMGWVMSNFLSAGAETVPIGNDNMTAAPSGTFVARDGPLNIAANKDEHFANLCVLIECEDLLTDPRFSEREARKQNRAALSAEINTALARNDVAHWVETLTNAGVPAGPVLNVGDVLAHPQIIERRLVQDLGSIDEGEQATRVLRTGYRFEDSEPAARTHPPRLGQHSVEVLRNLGIDDAEISALIEKGIISAQ